MLAPSSDLLRAGLGLKINQIKRATRSYLRDRTDHATGTVTSYVAAAGLFAASGIFLIAACFVGAVALFRWVEIHHGRFEAFGVVGALLLAIAAFCALLAASRLRRPSRHFPSLGSRLRVAITASPVKSGQIETVKAGAATSKAPASIASASRSRPGRQTTDLTPARDRPNFRAGWALTATLLGWAAARQIRMRRAPRTEA